MENKKIGFEPPFNVDRFLDEAAKKAGLDDVDRKTMARIILLNLNIITDLNPPMISTVFEEGFRRGWKRAFEILPFIVIMQHYNIFNNETLQRLIGDPKVESIRFIDNLKTSLNEKIKHLEEKVPNWREELKVHLINFIEGKK